MAVGNNWGDWGHVKGHIPAPVSAPDKAEQAASDQNIQPEQKPADKAETSVSRGPINSSIEG
jgi:hypothetical protein